MNLAEFVVKPHPQYEELLNWLEVQNDRTVIRDSAVKIVYEYEKDSDKWHTPGNLVGLSTYALTERLLHIATTNALNTQPNSLINVLWEGEEDEEL